MNMKIYMYVLWNVDTKQCYQYIVIQFMILLLIFISKTLLVSSPPAPHILLSYMFRLHFTVQIT
jgi:hypothetical protein